MLFYSSRMSQTGKPSLLQVQKSEWEPFLIGPVDGPGSTPQNRSMSRASAHLLISMRLEHRFSSLSLSIPVRCKCRSLQGPCHEVLLLSTLASRSLLIPSRPLTLKHKLCTAPVTNSIPLGFVTLLKTLYFHQVHSSPLPISFPISCFSLFPPNLSCSLILKVPYYSLHGLQQLDQIQI